MTCRQHKHNDNALSGRECWRFRLWGYGYGYDSTSTYHMLWYLQPTYRMVPTILYVLFNVNAWKRTEIEDQIITMSTETNPDAAAIADMESELRQLRQQNKELRSRLDVVLSTTATSQLPQAVAAREKATSNKAADDEYQLFRTPEHTPKKSQAIKGAAAAAPPEINNIYSVEMTELELLHTHKITPRLTVKKNIDGGGHYARIAAPAQSIGARDEEDPTKTTTANEDDSDSSSGDVFIDDDSHNKHQSREKSCPLL